MKKFKKNFENLKISKEDIETVIKTLKEKDLSWPYGITQKFEKEIAKFLKVKYVLAHCNGTSAMYAAMSSAGVGPGTEVICPSYTWWASAAPAINLGAKIVFCEINPSNLTIDPEDVKRKITKKTKAIIVPHLWGMFGDIETIRKITQKIGQKIYLIEDASHALGAKYKNHSLGTLGDVGIFSLQMGKPLPAGEGGLLVTNNYNLYEKAVFIGHYERIKDLKNDNIRKYKRTGGGYKFRIHPLGAALASSQLRTLEQKLEKQNLLMDYFEKKLKAIPKIQIFNKNPKDFVIGGRFGFRIGIKGKLPDTQIINNLKNEIFAENEYVPLLHLEPFFTERGSRYSKKGNLFLTEKLHQTLLGLPVFYRGNKSDIDSYVEKLKKLLGKIE